MQGEKTEAIKRPAPVLKRNKKAKKVKNSVDIEKVVWYDC